MKAFLSKEIRVVVLQGHRDNLVATRAGHSLGIDDHGRLTIIHDIVVR